ncbi:hypothetical protein IO44_03795 [Gallibacterium anatis str. Avicor]|uniref:hypothetical protein n=1 Tax=Gallibacterium anatis TaxID=750 RepID=UPI0005316E77|nr:hypothetical protein [Gallibacterium anatis]KGQ56084.1 hypothetical protein IO44_03795 [Gallibacterium anatis str. Avicor]
MKLFSFCFSLLLLLCAATANADWKQVGKAEYNWGPFHIYTVSLFTESGNYSSEQRPLMLRIKFAKPVEGKNFAISLFKEMALDKMPADQAESLRKRLIKNFPDFKPDDVLNYIALNDEGYFVLNDTVLDEHFDAPFNHEFIAIWLDSPSSFKQLQPRLLGEKKEEQTETATENATATATTKAEASTQQTADNNSTENKQQATKTAETEEKGKADNTSENSSHSANAKEEKTVEEKPIKADGNDKSASSLAENKSAEIDKKIQPSQPQASSTQEVTKKSADANQTAKMKEDDVKNQSISADTKTVDADTKATATNTQIDAKTAVNEEKTNAATDSKKSQQENSDTEQPKAQEPDAEEPIEPAIECDPILPFLKQHHC